MANVITKRGGAGKNNWPEDTEVRGFAGLDKLCSLSPCTGMVISRWGEKIGGECNMHGSNAS